MPRHFPFHLFFLVSAAIVLGQSIAVASDVSSPSRNEDLLFLDNGTVKIGINRAMGASITWLSATAFPHNLVNSADPGRLIQQSYYAGRLLDRTAEGQSASWSPWAWNPIQGGGVASWARVTECKQLEGGTLYSETIPKLWDMPDEEAAAVMRQWTRFEPDMPNVIRVRCEFVARRQPDDRWGPAKMTSQEIPAGYFVRRFGAIKSYLGNGRWRDQTQPPGPPWGQAEPPRQAMACFAPAGQGVAIFSPAATRPWNFGPHGTGNSLDPADGPCIHIAPIDRVPMGPQSTYRYRYWLVVGTAEQIAARLEELWKRYRTETAELSAYPKRGPTLCGFPVNLEINGFSKCFGDQQHVPREGRTPFRIGSYPSRLTDSKSGE